MSLAAPKVQPASRTVVEFLRRKGRDGATDDEIAIGTGLDKNTAAPARHELVRQGVVLNARRTRPTCLGVQATILILTSVAPPGAGLTIVRHVAVCARTLGGSVLQFCAACGATLGGGPFSHGQTVFEVDGAFSAEKLAGAHEVACRAARRKVRA